MSKPKNLSLDLIDICYPDYLLDHCNRDYECLISVHFTAFKSKQALKNALLDAIDQTPENITTSKYNRAIASYINSYSASAIKCQYHFILECNDLGKAHPIIDSDKITEIESYGYFRLSWE